MAPGLLLLIQEAGGASQEDLKALRPNGVVPPKVGGADPRAIVFLRCDPHADFADTLPLGIQVNQTHGGLRTAIVPLGQIAALSKHAGLHRIYPSQRLLPTLDRVNGFLTRLPAFQGIAGTGKGVLIGVIDSGVDSTHPAFAARIDRIWDQTLQGQGVAGFPYGTELFAPNLALSTDSIGHGTHVAAIAAGDDANFSGVAPGATIVAVKTTFNAVNVAEAIQYVFALAEEKGVPAVVNLSLGSHTDPHDGSDPLSQIIDEESGPGRIVCVAAGNEGMLDIHALAKVGAGQTTPCRFSVPRTSQDQPLSRVRIDGWYSGRDRVAVAVCAPDMQITPFQCPIPNGPFLRSHSLDLGTILISSPGLDPANNDHPFVIEIVHPTDRDLPVSHGVWQILLRGDAVSSGSESRVDLWISDNASEQVDEFRPFAGSKSNALFTGTSVDHSTKIGSPGCASRALTVGCYTTKTQWVDSAGGCHAVSLQPNSVADFSSPGPLRHGAKKPDCVLPGAMVIAARSQWAKTPPRYDSGQQRCVNGGSSMSAPVLAGLVARLLEHNSALTPEDVRAWLIGACCVPGRAAGHHDCVWGYGVLV